MTESRLLVNVDVPDLAQAEAFYRRALGLSVRRRFGSAAVELVGAEAPIYLLAKDPGSAPWPGAAAGRDYGRHWTPVHLDFAVADLDAAVTRAVEAGARREGPIVEARWGRMAVLADPFGHGLCLLEFGPLGYDAIAGPG